MAKAQKINIAQVQNELGMPNLTHSAIEEWLAEKGITTQAAADKFAESQKPQANPTGLFGQIMSGERQGYDSLPGPVKALAEFAGPGIGAAPVGAYDALKDLLTGGSKGAPPAQAVVPKEKPLPSPKEAATSAPESPFEQLAQALASEYLGQVQQLMPLTSGSAIFGQGGLTNQITNEAAAAIPGGGGWLQQQAAAEQKAAAPLQAAMSQVGEAQAQGAIPYAGAIANTGTANTAYLEAAPWQQILSELASETAYKAASSQGASAFGATPQNTPAFLQQIFSNLGLAGSANSGLHAPGSPTKAAKGGAGSSSSTLNPTTSQTG